MVESLPETVIVPSSPGNSFDTQLTEDDTDVLVRHPVVFDDDIKLTRYVSMFFWLGMAAICFFALESDSSSFRFEWVRTLMRDTFRTPSPPLGTFSMNGSNAKSLSRRLSNDQVVTTDISDSSQGIADSNIFSGVIENDNDSIATESSCPRSRRLPPFRGKKGIAMSFRMEHESGGANWQENLPKILALDGYWNYRWALARNHAQPDHLEFVPMVWGGGRSYETLVQLMQDLVQPYIERGVVRWIMAFNEPDHIEQANMSVERAVELWPAFEQLGIPIVSPSCVNPLGPWMLEFMRIAEERCLRVDWIGVHWYGGVNPETFKERMREVYRQYQRPLIITEFAPADWNAQTVEENRFTPEQVLDFAKQVLPWLESTNWIAGYSWSPFRIDRPQGTSSALFDANGELTALGRYYARFGTTRPRGMK